MAQVIDHLYFQRLSSALSEFLPSDFVGPKSSQIPEQVSNHSSLRSALHSLWQLRQLEANAIQFINTAPIGRLPNELLHAVFRYALEVERFNDVEWKPPQLHSGRLNALRGVCKNWNDLILACPKYWTCISLSESGPNVARFISRSGTLPLNIQSSSRSEWNGGYRVIFGCSHRIATLRCDRLDVWTEINNFVTNRIFVDEMETRGLPGNFSSRINYLVINVSRISPGALDSLHLLESLEHMRLTMPSIALPASLFHWPTTAHPSLKVIELDKISTQHADEVFRNLDAPQCRAIHYSPLLDNPESLLNADASRRFQVWASHLKRTVKTKGADVVVTVYTGALYFDLHWDDQSIRYRVSMNSLHGMLFNALQTALGTQRLRRVTLQAKFYKTIESATTLLDHFYLTPEVALLNASPAIASDFLKLLRKPMYEESIGRTWWYPHLQRLIISCGQGTCGEGRNLVDLVDTVKTRLKDKVLGESVFALAQIRVRIVCPIQHPMCQVTVDELRSLGVDCQWD